jgi:hypothetical protein
LEILKSVLQENLLMGAIKWVLALGLSFIVGVAYAGDPVTLEAPTIVTSMLVGSTYGPYTYRLVNHVGQPVNLAPHNPITVTGNVTDIVTLHSSCPTNSQGYYVPAGGCSFTLTFAPTTTGTITDSVHVDFTGGAMQPMITQAIPAITVTSLPVASLAAPTVPSSLVSGATQTLTYTLTNTSASDDITSVAISGYSGNVTLASNACTATVAPGGSCSFSMQLAPEATDIGALSQTLSVNYGGGSPLTSPIDLTVTTPTMIIGGSKLDPIIGITPYVFKSTDLGASWTEDTSATSALGVELNAAGGGAQTLIFAGTGVQKYDTGSGWTDANVPDANTAQSFAYGNGVFVAATRTPSIWHSTDGINWTAISVGTSLNNYANVAFGNGYYVAAFNGTAISDTSIYYYTQTPAVEHSWSSGTIGNGGELIYNFAYGAGKWVAVGYNSNNATANVHYSGTLGGTWTSASSQFLAVNEVMSVAYGNGKFVAIGYKYSGDSFAYTSTDGINWSIAATLGSFVPARHGLSYSASTGVFVVVGLHSVLYTSPDGSTWTLRSLPVSEVNLSGAGAETQTYDN